MYCLDPAPTGSFMFQSWYTEAPRDLRSNTKILPWTKLSLVISDLCSTVDLDRPWFPGVYGFQVVNRQSDLCVPVLDIVVFPCLSDNVLAVTVHSEVLAVGLGHDR